MSVRKKAVVKRVGKPAAKKRYNIISPRPVPMTPRVKNIVEQRLSKAKGNRLWYLLSKDNVRHYWNTIRAEMG